MSYTPVGEVKTELEEANLTLNDVGLLLKELIIETKINNAYFAEWNNETITDEDIEKE